MEFKNEHLTRQADLIPLSVLGERITVIGAGAIGSLTTLALVKMGFCNLTVLDFDTVSVENMNSQFYRFDDINRPKVVALQELIHGFTRVRIEGINARWERGHFPGTVISAVDSMEVRRQIWEAHRGKSPMTRLVIDPRMGAETALQYAMNPMSPEDHVSYEKTLYTGAQAVQEPCTAKATMYTALMLSGLVAKTVKNAVMGTAYPRVVQWSIAENQLFAWKSSSPDAPKPPEDSL